MAKWKAVLQNLNNTWSSYGQTDIEAQENLISNLQNDCISESNPDTKDLLDSAITLVENGLKMKNWIMGDPLTKYDFNYGKFTLRLFDEDENVINNEEL